MADQLVRIFGPVAIPEGDSIVFTGTRGHIYTIKHIVVANNTSGAISIALGINGLDNQHIILPSSSIDAGGWAEYDGLLVLANTDTFQATTSLDGLTITASGLDQG